MNFEERDALRAYAGGSWIGLAFLAALVYGAIAYVPVFIDYMTVKKAAQELAESLQYKTSSRRKATASFVRRVRESTGIKVKPRMVKTHISRDRGAVQVEVRLKMKALFPGLNKRHRMRLTVHGSSSP